MKIVRFASPLFTVVLCLQASDADAQALQAMSANVTVDVPGHSVVNDQGVQPTDPSELLYRNGPNNPITNSSGTQLTWGDFNQVAGTVKISPRPGGGTDVDVDVTGLVPGEVYSIWAGWWDTPNGFPTGTRIAFGAVTDADNAADTDNFMTADASGKISLDLIQPKGPMTLHGSAPSYAAWTPAFDSNGIGQEHTGYAVGIAYHFNNAPGPPFFPGPGPPETWALHGIAGFEPIESPEPSTVLLLALGIGGVAGSRRQVCRS